MQAQKDIEREEQLDLKIDKVINETGGFGLFQCFLSVSYFINNKSVMLLIVSLAYLQKVPQEYFCTYEGSEEPVKCKPEEFCNNPKVKSYEPNWDLDDTYDNWVMRFDLHCASKGEIGLITSAFFMGWVFTLTWMPRFSDIFGRQKVFIAGTFITFLSFSVLLVTESYSSLIACMFTFGMVSTVRVNVGVNYMYESMHRDHYVNLCTFMAMGEGVIGTFATLYFMFISKGILGLLLIIFSLNVVSMISSFFYPESPRFLIKSGRIEEANQVFNLVAQAN